MKELIKNKITNINITENNIKGQLDKSTIINIWNNESKKSKTFFVSNKFIRYNEKQDTLSLGLVDDFEYSCLTDEKTEDLPKIKGNDLVEWIKENANHMIIKKVNLNIYK